MKRALAVKLQVHKVDWAGPRQALKKYPPPPLAVVGGLVLYAALERYHARHGPADEAWLASISIAYSHG